MIVEHVKQSTGRRSAEPHERPFLMGGEEVRAALSGLKTQARRVVDGATGAFWDHAGWTPTVDGTGILWTSDNNTHRMAFPCPYGAPGERLYVRETWAGDDCCGYVYRADHPDADLRAGDLDDGEQSIRRWRSPAAMPRKAARLILTLTALRVERLQDITVADIIAEGVHVPPVDYSVPERPDVLDFERKCFARDLFASRWERRHKRHPERQWAANPWVWVPEFTVERVA